MTIEQAVAVAADASTSRRLSSTDNWDIRLAVVAPAVALVEREVSRDVIDVELSLDGIKQRRTDAERLVMSVSDT